MELKKLLLFLPFLFLLAKEAYAHCPLCTIGAAAAAAGASYLGVDKIIVGIFIGAFAVSMGWWISRLIKKKYIPFQRPIIIILSFVTTVIPLLAVVGESAYPLYISLMGSYGSLLNSTYILNLFLVGSILGGLIVIITPSLSSIITKSRNGRMLMPYQGIVLTFAILIIASLIVQFVL